MAAITICSDFGAQKNKVSHCFPIYFPWSGRTRCSISDLPVLHSLPELDPSSCPLNHWCYLTISSSATLFSFCLQSSPGSGSFPMSWLFASGSQIIGASFSVSVLPMNIQGWFPLGLSALISLQAKGLSRVYSSTTIWRHHLFEIKADFSLLSVGKGWKLTLALCTVL